MTGALEVHVVSAIKEQTEVNADRLLASRFVVSPGTQTIWGGATHI